jgi:hypothetical protein
LPSVLLGVIGTFLGGGKNEDVSGSGSGKSSASNNCSLAAVLPFAHTSNATRMALDGVVKRLFWQRVDPFGAINADMRAWCVREHTPLRWWRLHADAARFESAACVECGENTELFYAPSCARLCKACVGSVPSPDLMTLMQTGLRHSTLQPLVDRGLKPAPLMMKTNGAATGRDLDMLYVCMLC